MPQVGTNYVNHNKLLWRCPGCLGGKTGYTQAAGRCLVSCCEREGTRLYCVTLNAPDDWNDHMALYDWGFARYVEPDVTAQLFATACRSTAGQGGGSPLRAEPWSCFLPKDAELRLRVELPPLCAGPGARRGDRRAGHGAAGRGELGGWPCALRRRVEKQGETHERKTAKIIAASGLMARRKAEEAIAAGRVTVNGLPAPGGQRRPGDRYRSWWTAKPCRPRRRS